MRNLSTFLCGTAAALTLAAAIACSGDDSDNSTGPSGSCTPSSNPATLVVQNNAICPQAITVTRGGQDPHPSHTDCPELNQIGTLNTGQQRQSGNLNTARTCGMHDHSDPDRASLRATITIQ